MTVHESRQDSGRSKIVDLWFWIFFDEVAEQANIADGIAFDGDCTGLDRIGRDRQKIFCCENEHQVTAISFRFSRASRCDSGRGSTSRRTLSMEYRCG